MAISVVNLTTLVFLVMISSHGVPLMYHSYSHKFLVKLNYFKFVGNKKAVNFEDGLNHTIQENIYLLYISTSSQCPVHKQFLKRYSLLYIFFFVEK